MQGIINKEDHNKVVETVNAKIKAINEAAELGIKALNSTKPNPVKSIGDDKTHIKPRVNHDGSYSKFSDVSIAGYGIHEHNGTYSIMPIGVDKDYLMFFAACIIKAFGPIPQELIYSVEVK